MEFHSFFILLPGDGFVKTIIGFFGKKGPAAVIYILLMKVSPIIDKKVQLCYIISKQMRNLVLSPLNEFKTDGRLLP